MRLALVASSEVPTRGAGRSLGWRAAAPVLGVAVAVSSCWQDVPTQPPPAGVESVVIDGSAGPIFRTLRVTLDRPGPLDITYGTDGEPTLLVESPAETREHEVFLPRLRSSSTYLLEIRTVDPLGRRSQAFRVETVTGVLPTALREIELQVEGVPTAPLVLFEPLEPLELTTPFVVDGHGHIVWYRPGGPHQSQGFERLDNGDFVFALRWRPGDAAGAPGAVVVRPNLEVVAEITNPAEWRVHHDLAVTAQNTVLLLTDSDQRAFDDTVVVADAIWEWNPATGDLVERWAAWDFLSPDVDVAPRSQPRDWIHANSVSIGPRGNVLVSLFWLQEVLSVAPDFASVEWRLGGPRSSFQVTGGAMDGGQHTAHELPSGRILMFDNGRDRPGGAEYSRAVEVEIDPTSGTANLGWEFRPQPDVFAPIVSSAFRWDNGNTFVTFGVGPAFATLSDGPIVVYEVSSQGDVVWSARVLNGIDLLYRATPLQQLDREVIGVLAPDQS